MSADTEEVIAAEADRIVKALGEALLGAGEISVAALVRAIGAFVGRSANFAGEESGWSPLGIAVEVHRHAILELEALAIREAIEQKPADTEKDLATMPAATDTPQ